MKFFIFKIGNSIYPQFNPQGELESEGRRRRPGTSPFSHATVSGGGVPSSSTRASTARSTVLMEVEEGGGEGDSLDMTTAGGVTMGLLATVNFYVKDVSRIRISSP